MDSKLRKQLEDVFGGGGQVAPGGTGAVLVGPSKLSLDLGAEVVRELPLDRIFKDLGAVAAREMADALELRLLKPSDYARLPELPSILAKRLVARLVRSEEFARSFQQHLGMRG